MAARTKARHRVAVTGMGVVTPLGIGVPAFRKALSAGKCGIGPITHFSCEGLTATIAAEVKDFNPRTHLEAKHFQQSDRYSQFAGVAAAEAVAMAGLTKHELSGGASVIGTGIGGQTTQEESYWRIFGEGKTRIHPLTILRLIGSSAASHLSIEYGLTGPAFATVSACAAGAHAIGLVTNMIREGMVTHGLAGGAEATLTWGTVKAWDAMRVLSSTGCRPFSRNRDGLVLGEGAGVLVLERRDRAQARGAQILAEIRGFGMTADAADMVNPSAEGAARAMKAALNQAGLPPDEVGHVNAHGTGTAANDVTETRAIHSVFGKAAGRLAISATKSMHGHGLGAGGAMEAVAAIVALRDGFAPPTINLDLPDPACDLDYTPHRARPLTTAFALSNSFAFGGLNAVLLMGHPDAD